MNLTLANFTRKTIACPPLLQNECCTNKKRCSAKYPKRYCETGHRVCEGGIYCQIIYGDAKPAFSKLPFGPDDVSNRYVFLGKEFQGTPGADRTPQNRTRRSILQRAIGWIAMNAPYQGCGTPAYQHTIIETCAEDETTNCPNYLYTGSCNGLIEMALGTPDKKGVPQEMHNISCSDLEPGDVMRYNSQKGGWAHYTIFRSWVGDVLGDARVYQMGGEEGTANVDVVTADKFCTNAHKRFKCYSCTRYNYIQEEADEEEKSKKAFTQKWEGLARAHRPNTESLHQAEIPFGNISLETRSKLVDAREKVAAWLPIVDGVAAQPNCDSASRISCDATFWNGILCSHAVKSDVSSTACSAIARAQSSNGMLWRSPWEAQAQNSSNPDFFSRDQGLATLASLTWTKNATLYKRWLDYISGPGKGSMCPGHWDCTLVAPFWCTFDKVAKYAGFPQPSESLMVPKLGAGFCNNDHLYVYISCCVNENGSALHLAALDVYIRRMIGDWSPTLQAAANKLHARDPENALVFFFASCDFSTFISSLFVITCFYLPGFLHLRYTLKLF